MKQAQVGKIPGYYEFYQHFLQASYPLAFAADLVVCLAFDGFIRPQLFLL